MALRKQSPIISGNRIRMEPQKLVVSDHESHPAPKIVLRKDGDIIQAIEISCACGSQVILDCRYAEDGEAA